MAYIHGLAFDGHARGWSEDEFQTLLHDAQVFCVHQPNGFALGRVTLTEGELLTIATHPDHQGQGTGHQTLAAFLEELRRRGADSAFLEVARDNHTAIALYTSAGFAELGCRKAYYHRRDGARVDALILRRGITA
ncbi:MAG: GNAT family N-acetyltransferase [Roseovarius sp.]